MIPMTEARAPETTHSSFGSQRADLWLQILLVLGVSLGASALWSLLDLAETLSTSSIAESTASMNAAQSGFPLFDVLRRGLGILLALVPPLLALYFLAGSSGQLRGDQRPALGAVPPDQGDDRLVFLGSPLPLDQVGVQDFLPAVEALDVGPVVEVGRFCFLVLWRSEKERERKRLSGRKRNESVTAPSVR